MVIAWVELIDVRSWGSWGDVALRGSAVGMQTVRTNFHATVYGLRNRAVVDERAGNGNGQVTNQRAKAISARIDIDIVRGAGDGKRRNVDFLRVAQGTPSAGGVAGGRSIRIVRR